MRASAPQAPLTKEPMVPFTKEPMVPSSSLLYEYKILSFAGYPDKDFKSIKNSY